MSLRTAIIEFHMDVNMTSNKAYREDLVKKVESALDFLGLKSQHEFAHGPTGLTVVLVEDTNNVSCVMKILPNGLVTLTVEEWSPTPILTNQVSEDLRRNLQNILDVKVERIPVLRHGDVGLRYFTTSDERILEYDFDALIVECNSPYQNIKIFHSPTLGNCLFLDDLQNLGECDLSYTRGLMKFGEMSYEGKEVLILGGGDGGLLHELLKEKPKFVTMVDIDKKVMDLCQTHLRGACGDTLDSFTGHNYEVIVDDCMKKLEEYAQNERFFDVIFNDLTDIPIGTTPQDELWEFIEKVVTLSFGVLKPEGRYLNHATGENATSGLKCYENLLKRLPFKVEFQNHSAYVPSFMENWVFYEVWRSEQ